MDTGVVIVVGLIGGVVAASIAFSKGRNVIGWFFFGFFFPLIALIVALVVSNKKEEERARTHATSERRRLREQLRQEKMKTDTFRRHAAGRLDVHDAALGLDTRVAPGLAGGRVVRPLGTGPSPANVQAAAPPPPIPKQAAEVDWYYEADGESHGPVPQSTLVWMLETGAVTVSTLLWTEGQRAWAPASSIAAFRDIAQS